MARKVMMHAHMSSHIPQILMGIGASGVGFRPDTHGLGFRV